MELCDICQELHEIEQDAPFYREFVSPRGAKTRKWICLFHEVARKRLLLFRQREARALDRDAMLEADPQTGHTSAFSVQ